MAARRETVLPTLRRGASWLLAQLVVVFIGVYAASWVADREAAQARERRRAQLRRALVTELRDATRNTRGAARSTAAALAFYDSSWKAGARPPLQPFTDPVRWTPQMWNATVSAGGLELLDVPTFYALSEFYNELSSGFDVLGHMSALSDRYLIPVADQPAAEFYEPNSARLKARYRWYIASTRRVNRIAERLTARGDSLADLLERGAGATPHRAAAR
ncbi:MAG: hypothetical protein AVDCRST_MAG11-777 [uncultured Gemmatimonadaceae bacterium]|uniref:Uncharacterized protein n=1 Tax=uncultured Gemmatimonadaceae bacterium TaxID=246130 RepID=A0A6J4KBY2_9BACT|nr:MAG: hypothetical protein AVDCRST_MAG11-777 [uncultured Gemmatimonadaceae bacterium]